MALNDVLKFISEASGNRVNASNPAPAGAVRGINDAARAFERANQVALDTVADRAVAIVKGLLSRDYYVHGPAGPNESPSSRTGTLRDSIHWKAGRSSRQFPGPFPDDIKKTDLQRFSKRERGQYNWYQKIKNKAYENRSLITPYPTAQKARANVRVIEVDPHAADRSSRQRLEYYSYFLETGWNSARNEFHKDTGKAGSIHNASPKKPKHNSHSDGTGWNPPRPYLRKLDSPEYRNELENLYQTVLARELPEQYKNIASRCKLTVSYNHSLRVPYLSDNKHLLD